MTPFGLRRNRLGYAVGGKYDRAIGRALIQFFYENRS
jgi:hypothetical protein